ncbi:MAG: hypothetical protein LBJ20_00915, partial [Candidatus Methanoplasma sp.]|nr:hypothetical protein [Candidatus Methanoplasma sp.]
MMKYLAGLFGTSTVPSFDVFVTDSVNVTIAEGAVITSGDRAATVAESVTFAAGDNVDGAFLISSGGNVYSADVTTPTAPVFRYIPFGTYTLVVYSGTNVWYSTDASVSQSAFSLGRSDLTLPADKAKLTLDSTNSKLITYTSGTYDFVFALRGNELGVSESVNDTTGGILFGTAVGTGDKVFAVMKLRGQTGTPLVCFLGTFSGAGTAAGLLKAVTSDPANAEDIKVRDFKSAGPSKKGAIGVIGELVLKKAEVSAGVITVTGKVSVSSDSKLTAYDKVIIGEVPELSPLSAEYTNTASVTG